MNDNVPLKERERENLFDFITSFLSVGPSYAVVQQTSSVARVLSLSVFAHLLSVTVERRKGKNSRLTRFSQD